MTPDSQIDTLFALPLAEFTAARNALASRLRKQGRGGESERVKAIPKPSATAWAVNQLFWRHRKELERLLTIGDKVREAQTKRPADVRRLLEERRTAVSGLINRAAEILADAGHAASPDARRKMSITLESLAAWGHSDDASQAGRLTADLEPLGFDGLAALLGGKKLGPANVLQFRRAGQEKKTGPDATVAARAQANEAVKAAEKALTAARRDAARAEATLSKANERAEALETQKRKLDARYNKAQEQARAAVNEMKKAAQSVAEADRVLARARAALKP